MRIFDSLYDFEADELQGES